MSCSCSEGNTLIFACSGAADVGEICDRAARQLTKLGKGKMFCTPGLGGKVEGILNTTAKASKIIALDGCNLSCVKNSLENAGFTDYTQVCLTDKGFTKGQSPADEININKAVKLVCEVLD